MEGISKSQAVGRTMWDQAPKAAKTVARLLMKVVGEKRVPKRKNLTVDREIKELWIPRLMVLALERAN